MRSAATFAAASTGTPVAGVEALTRAVNAGKRAGQSRDRVPFGTSTHGVGGRPLPIRNLVASTESVRGTELSIVIGV